MEKFVPLEKRSKKERQKENALRRGSWNGLNPVTRRSENPKAYNRKKARKWREEPFSVPFFVKLKRCKELRNVGRGGARGGKDPPRGSVTAGAMLDISIAPNVVSFFVKVRLHKKYGEDRL